MAAYYVEHYPAAAGSLAQTRELAEKLDVDEIHFFTPEGIIYAGTHPQYYGYTFHSGEQMEYFLPMLKDHSLQMCQDIMPNTAEGKEMQYAAVWSEDKRMIVQIGMKPNRVLQEIKDTSLENVIAALPMDLRGYLHVVDVETKTIIASTSEKLVGENFDTGEKYLEGDGLITYHYRLEGNRYCVYARNYKNYTMIRTYLSSYLLQNSIISTGLVLLYMTAVAVVVISVIVWYVNRKISRNLTSIVNELKKIEEGNLENLTLQTEIQEFDELILYINKLLKSIRLNWSKLSYVIDKGRLPIGIFEDNRFYKKTFMNQRLLEILRLGEKEETSSETLEDIVRDRIRQAENSVVDQAEKICLYAAGSDKIYLRIEKLEDEQSTTYYITDMSLWWNEIKLLREKSSRDSLTGLYNRSGFHDHMNHLLAYPEKLSHGALLMIDADNLKKINDIYGHSAGDEYLKKIAAAIAETEAGRAICARLGGDEFAVFFYGYQTCEEIRKVIGKLKARRGSLFRSEHTGAESTLEFSMGVAFYPEEGLDYHLLMHLADENMYQEKKKRKNDNGS